MPLSVCDAPEVFKWCGDPLVNTFMIYNLYHSVREVEEWLKSQQNNETLFGMFLCDGTLIGSADCSLCGRGEVRELGYNMHKQYWGKGYGTETALALIAYSAEKYGTYDFYVSHAVENFRSQRVAEKCGFVFDKFGSYKKLDGSKTFVSKEYSLHITKHEMNVDGEWFEKIVSGTKTVELRLYDEKRRAIQIGEYIVLHNLDAYSNLSVCVVRVAALHKFDSFTTLYKNLDMSKCGYAANGKLDADDMLRYYSFDRQQEWGVVDIEFDLLCAM
ncbi:MAG: GNAT family N-acetyltransferase [Corallococcus sp.]|nr:GNAT family N-acetyltransferase [Corallococcus sp.]MCM1359804.1 GNAT family N-acetyltransferase [Corallococcus sp.]